MLKPYVFTQAFSPSGFDPATSGRIQKCRAVWRRNVRQPCWALQHQQCRQRVEPLSRQSCREWRRQRLRTSVAITTMKAGVDYIYQNRLQRNLYQQFTFRRFRSPAISTRPIPVIRWFSRSAWAARDFYCAKSPDLGEDYFNMMLWSGYVQDSWRRRVPTLTLNIGFRYEIRSRHQHARQSSG